MSIAAHVEVSNDFFHDCLDFLYRYRVTVDHMFAVKSRRMKLFLDLRMAAECILKAYVSHFVLTGVERQALIPQLQRYGHNVDSLSKAVQPIATPEVWAALEPMISPLSELPVGLRYRLDGSDFREVNERLYYATIGSDTWLDKLHDTLKLAADALDSRLQSHSRLVPASDLLSELEIPRYNKYAKAPPPEGAS